MDVLQNKKAWLCHPFLQYIKGLPSSRTLCWSRLSLGLNFSICPHVLQHALSQCCSHNSSLISSLCANPLLRVSSQRNPTCCIHSHRVPSIQTFDDTPPGSPPSFFKQGNEGSETTYRAHTVSRTRANTSVSQVSAMSSSNHTSVPSLTYHFPFTVERDMEERSINSSIHLHCEDEYKQMHEFISYSRPLL